jgi:putative membrane protein
MYVRSHDIPFKKNWPLHIMIAVFVLIWGVLAIKPVEWKEWLLENVLLILFVGLLAFLYRTFKFNNISYLLITIFCILHAVGAHYTYRHTPLDDWIKDIFHTKRAIYDRIVHCAFGLFIAFPILEVAVRVLKLRRIWSYVVTFTALLAASAMFEIIEMLASLIAGSLGKEYLGLQGDPLDTQKDMSMTLIGSLISIGLIAWIRKKKYQHKLGEQHLN